MLKVEYLSVGLLSNYFFNRVNLVINYFDHALIAVLTYINSVLCYSA